MTTLFTLFYCTVFFFNDTATTEIYTLSLHDALPISLLLSRHGAELRSDGIEGALLEAQLRQQSLGIGQGIAGDHDIDVAEQDRKSTRLNSSHANISYAVFCLKKKKISNNTRIQTSRT